MQQDSKFALSTFNFWIFERKIPTTNVTLYVKSCQYLRCINSCVNFQKKKSLWPPSQFLYSSLHLQFNLTEVLFFLKVILAVCVYQLFFQEWFKEKVLVNMSSSILRRLTQSVQWKTFFFLSENCRRSLIFLETIEDSLVSDFQDIHGELHC